mgnify:CR=1 FL=1
MNDFGLETMEDREGEVIAIPRPPFDPLEVISFVAIKWGTTPRDVLSRSRIPEHVTPRWIAARVMRERGMSFPMIARRFAMDHSSFVHASQAFDRKYRDAPQVWAVLDAARARFLP